MALNRIEHTILAALLALAAAIAIPPAAAAEEPDCGGARVLAGTGGSWECTFGDEFDGDGLDGTKWVAQRTETSGYTNGPTACFVDSPNNVSVSGGSLKLTARREAEPFTCRDPHGDFETRYTSGMVSTAEGRFSQTFGRFEARMKVPPAQVKGLHTAFWLWPVDAMKYGYPDSGEIDIAEMYSQYPDRAIPFVHYDALPGSNVTNNFCMVSDLSAFHTYAAEWTASSLKIVYDGQTCLEHHWNPVGLVKPAPFDHPFFVVLTQALGIGTNDFDSSATPLPATTEVDYVRVWKWQPGPESAPQPSPQPAPKASPRPTRKASAQRACRAASKTARAAKSKRARKAAKRACKRRR